MEKNIVCESFGKEDYSFSVCCQGWDKKVKLLYIRLVLEKI